MTGRPDQRSGAEPHRARDGIGSLLSRARAAAGYSQLCLAELLCSLAGGTTLTRHEISRWEREERIPSAYWMGWLAAALRLRLEDLAAAAARARSQRRARGLAAAPGTRLPCQHDDGSLAGLHRMEDLLCGTDLSRTALRSLHTTSQVPGRPDANRQATVARLTQLCVWVLADAGRPAETLRMAERSLVAAESSDQRPLAAHVLGFLAEQWAEQWSSGRVPATLSLAERAHRYAAATSSPGARTIQLYRIAYTAALLGLPDRAEPAIAEAEQCFDQADPATEPDWLYWLDEAHVAALSGRCYAAMHRPRLARALLGEAMASAVLPPRAEAMAAIWLATAHLDSGNLEAACASARTATLATVRCGSLRASVGLRRLDQRLRGRAEHQDVRSYLAFARRAVGYLPCPGTELGIVVDTAAGTCANPGGGEEVASVP